jgi:hypothetical protein
MWENHSNLLVKGWPMMPPSVEGFESLPQLRLRFFLALLGVSVGSVLLFLRWLSQDRNLAFFSQQVIVDTLLHLLVLAETFPLLIYSLIANLLQSSCFILRHYWPCEQIIIFEEGFVPEWIVLGMMFIITFPPNR